MPHLLLALSAHGYGHAAQSIAVLNGLRAALPDLRLSIVTDLPRAFLADRLDGEFDHYPRETDIGMLQQSALELRAADSLAAYARFHTDWPARVAQEARWLETLRPDLVLANVPYLILAAAAKADIPALAMSSLNWADLYAHYFGRDRIHGEMLAAYRSAEFLRLTPGMPMTDLERRRDIGPVARIGRARRAELRARLGLDEITRMVLIAPGGIGLRVPIERWPRIAGIHWLVPDQWEVRVAQASGYESLGWPFTDVLASCDALIGKPGYGTFVEVACGAVPMLYVRRVDGWPEQPYLIEWLEANGRALEITPAQLEAGELSDALARLWAMPSCAPVMPSGVGEVVALLAQRLAACV